VLRTNMIAQLKSEMWGTRRPPLLRFINRKCNPSCRTCRISLG